MDKSHTTEAATIELFNGQIFKTEDEAFLVIDEWCRINFCPLTKIRRRKPGVDKKGERVKGQRGYKCAHGVERISRSKDERRPFQRVKFTGCEAKLNINEQEDGTWMITSCFLKHEGHEVSENNFYSKIKRLMMRTKI